MEELIKKWCMKHNFTCTFEQGEALICKDDFGVILAVELEKKEIVLAFTNPSKYDLDLQKDLANFLCKNGHKCKLYPSESDEELIYNELLRRKEPITLKDIENYVYSLNRPLNELDNLMQIIKKAWKDNTHDN